MTSFDDAWNSGGDPSPSSSFEDAWNSTPEPSFLQKSVEDVKAIPSAIMSVFSAIPSGVQNLIDLPKNVYTTAKDAYNLAAGNDFTPDWNSYSQLDRTLKGIGAPAAWIAGSELPGVGPLLGGALGLEGYNKANQLTGADASTTAEQDLNNLRRNIIQGGALGLAGDVAAYPFNKASTLINPGEALSPEDLQIQTLKPTAGDVARVEKALGRVATGDEPAIEQALQGAKERGVFTGSSDPAEIMARQEVAKQAIMDQIHGPEGILTQIDNAAKVTPEIAAKIPSSGSLIQDALNAIRTNEMAYQAAKNGAPDAALQAAQVLNAPLTFSNATRVINDHPFQADALNTQLQNRMQIIHDLYDGNLSTLSKIKSSLYKDAFSGNGQATSKILDQAIASDLRQAIENRANDISPGFGDQVRNLNAQWAEHRALDPLIEKAVNNAVAQGFKPQRSTVQAATDALKGGVGGEALSLLTGHGFSPTALILGALYKGGTKVLDSPYVQGVIQNTLRSTSNALGKTGQVINATADIATPVVIGNENNDIFSSLFSKAPMNNDTINKIKADPYYSALAQAESSFNPNATPKINPETGKPLSTAKGLFQLTDATARALGVQDPFNPEQAFQGVQKLTNEHRAMFGNNPDVLYAAHYLGAGLLRKVLNHEPLDPIHEQPLVDSLAPALKHFKAAYAAATSKTEMA